MSDKKCCVPGCASPEGPAVLHRFPNPEKDRQRLNAWLMAIGGDILALENNHIYKYRRVCHIHFETRYHCRNNRISNVAVPSLNLAGPLSLPQFSFSERRPLMEVQNFEPSTSKDVPQPPVIFGEWPNSKELENKELFTSEAPETPKYQGLPSDLPLTIEERAREVVPSSSDSQLNRRSDSGSPAPETPKHQGLPSDLLLTIEERAREVVPSSSDSQLSQRSDSGSPEPEPQGGYLQPSDTTQNKTISVPRKHKGILPKECQQTADLLLFVDNIFDSVNGSFKNNKNAKPLLGPATPTSPHKKTWSEGRKMFKSMKYVNAAGKEEPIPTLANWVWTLDGLEILLKKLQNDYNVTSVWLRHLNQDPLEDFFGSVRSHGCRNVNPTCNQYESAFCTLLINNINSINSRGKNCEDDFCETLHALVVNDNDCTPESTSSSTYDFADVLNINFTPVNEKETDPRKIAPLQYTGWAL